MKRFPYLISICLFCITHIPFYGQEKAIEAVRTEQQPRIDGVLNDSCWLKAHVANGFLTNEPVFGNPPAEETEVRLLYDDNALYLAYFMHDKEPDQVIAVFAERDKTILADEVMLGLDTYYDKTSAFRFQVTASGVQTDRYMSPFILRTDRTWDAVWESVVQKDEKGWYAEMRIPFSALRFPKSEHQQWGIQFGRFVGRTGEFTTWSPVNPAIGGGPVRQWGIVTGITGVHTPIRLSLWPYVTAGFQRTPVFANQDKYRFEHEPFYAGGMDLKYGINQSFTLDMSLVPDFSQVQSDNIILNLTPFEIKYEERRQFFTESTDLFNKAGIFYSRRIGAVPSGFGDISNQLLPNEKIVENPSQVSLINATKVSGRTRNGLGIGFLNAITATEKATIMDTLTHEARIIETEPFSNYNIFVLDQSLANNSKLGLINTNVHRKGNAVNANVTALDALLNSKGNMFALTTTAIYSVRHDKQMETSQNGYNYKIDLAKVSGRWRFELFSAAVSKDYNPKDLGLLSETNLMQSFGALRYYSYEPKGAVLNWNASLSYLHVNTLNDLSFQKSEIELISYALLQNFSNASFTVNWNPVEGNDIYEPRTPGRYFRRPQAVRVGAQFNTDTRKRSQLQISGAAKWFEFPAAHFLYSVGASPVVRIGDHIILSFTSLYSMHRNNQAFATRLDALTPVFGLRQERSFESIAVFQYLFSPYSNLSLRARDYWSKVEYDQYYLLNEKGRLEAFDFSGSADVNFHLLNIDMIYTWQYAPGSFLSLSWKTNAVQNAPDDDGYIESVRRIIDYPKSTSVSVRINYYFDYARVRNRKSNK